MPLVILPLGVHANPSKKNTAKQTKQTKQTKQASKCTQNALVTAAGTFM